jgi:hypothetical protein
VLARPFEPDASHSKQPTNRTSQDHALDPEVGRDALSVRAHCSVAGAGRTGAGCVSCQRDRGTHVCGSHLFGT